MNKEFVPYEEALALKELGFNEPCFGFFHEKCEDNDLAGCSGKFQTMCGWVVGRETTNDLSSHDFIVVRPTFSQAFRWFREKYDLCQCVTPSSEKKTIKYEFGVFEEGYCNLSQIKGGYPTYEEAELACLRKLIEIVKNEN